MHFCHEQAIRKFKILPSPQNDAILPRLHAFMQAVNGTISSCSFKNSRSGSPGVHVLYIRWLCVCLSSKTFDRRSSRKAVPLTRAGAMLVELPAVVANGTRIVLSNVWLNHRHYRLRKRASCSCRAHPSSSRGARSSSSPLRR